MGIPPFTGPVFPHGMGTDAAGNARVPDKGSNPAVQPPWLARYR